MADIPLEEVNQMSKKNISFKRDKTDASDILRWHDEGYNVLCPICKSKLLIAKTAEEAGENSPGIFCPQNKMHIGIYFEGGGRKRMWQAIDDLRTNRKITKANKKS